MTYFRWNNKCNAAQLGGKFGGFVRTPTYHRPKSSGLDIKIVRQREWLENNFFSFLGKIPFKFLSTQMRAFGSVKITNSS